MALRYGRLCAVLLSALAGHTAIAQEADDALASDIEPSQSLSHGNLIMCGFVYRGVVAKQSYREGKMLAIVGSINATRPPGKMPGYYLKAQLYQLDPASQTPPVELPIEFAYLTLSGPKFSTSKMKPNGVFSCDSGLGYCGAFTAGWETVWASLGSNPSFSIFVTPKGATFDIGVKLRPDWNFAKGVYEPTLPMQRKVSECMKQMTNELEQEVGQK